MSHTQSSPSLTPSRTLLEAKLITNSLSHPLKALVDSGSDENFIDTDLVTQHNIPITLLPRPRGVSALDGRHLARITHQTEPLTLVTSGNHRETIQFLVISSPHSPLVLGQPWLQCHNPHVDWRRGGVIGWSTHCYANCLRSASPSSSLPPSPPLHPPDLSQVPPEYHDLQEVFSKDRALILPPHRPYDCAINLLPGHTFPSSRLYNISKPEREVMEKYIQESLAGGLIRPSSSPVGAGFFFVKKKDGSLRPCIDFRGLNNITIRNKYPLPLIDAAFSPLHEAAVFSKLDLRNAYHLVRIKEGDEWKTAFNTPLGHFEYCVMPFGLTNAPAVFQNLVNDVLRDMLNRIVFVYLDDILIFSRNLQEHQQHVRLVLQRLLENKLLRRRNVCSIPNQFLFWDSSWRRGSFGRTQRRCRQ